MKNELTSPGTTGNKFALQGTVHNNQQQPLPQLIVRAYNKGIRSNELLGESLTDSFGLFNINYVLEKPALAGIIVSVFDKNNILLLESDIHYNITPLLQINMEVNAPTLTALSVFDQLLNTVAPFLDQLPLSQLTENDEHQDITFIAQKTGLPQEKIEKLALASRFETLSSIPAHGWFGLLYYSPKDSSRNTSPTFPAMQNFESRLNSALDGLMHISTNALIKKIEEAINENIIASSVKKELPKIKAQLDAFSLSYAKQHPTNLNPSLLYQKSMLGGLKGKELEAFLAAYKEHAGPEESFWKNVSENNRLKNNKNIEKTQAVFLLSQLTGNDMALTEKIIKSEKVNTVADVKKMAAYTRNDWAKFTEKPNNKSGKSLLTKNQLLKDDRVDLAKRLESSFTNTFPTAAFASRLQNDNTSNFPQKDKVSKFLTNNAHFDLLNDNVGKFLKENSNTISENNSPELAAQLRQVQRVFRLVPVYDSAKLLLNNNIHSAYQVHKIGEDNFVKTYGSQLGEKEAREVFSKADQVHANSLALLGNLKSMSEASAMKAFPDFSTLLSNQLVHELPNLDKLFGHTDFCECAECNSVYGAPAYLTDILHYLDQRSTSLPSATNSSGSKIPSVKDLLLKRRPDIGDIDLECNNTNTEIPYIDVACEIMEDYIAPPAISIVNTFLPKLVKGVIDAALLTEIVNQFTTTGQTNVSVLLTPIATVSAPYTTDKLQGDNTYLTQTNWIIRDSQVAIRASTSQGAATIDCRLLHQTLLTSEAVGAGAEYINTDVYNNFLKKAKRPFTLPFDLFETEGEWYMEKLGVKKIDLINTFRKEDKLAPGASPADLAMAYTSMGINEAEQTLIFVADATNQSLYWGTAAAGSTIQVDVFEKLTGLNYSQIVDLVSLKFINPLKDTLIERDDLSSDTTKQRVINLTPVKLDAIHRFLRLWRKTSFTMYELDTVISSAYGKGKIDTNLAWQLYQLRCLQQITGLDIFQLLAFYDLIDINTYNALFQNNEITNPLDPDFSFKTILAGTLVMAEKHKSVVAAVLRISLDDVNTLYAKTVQRLSINSLSFINRNVQLSRALDITVADFLTLQNLIDANPFLSPYSTNQFIKKYKLLQSSGFNIEELNYVLRHQDNSTQSFIPSDSLVLANLSTLQNELLAGRAATQPVLDTNGVLLSKWLSDLVFQWNNTLRDKLLDILNTTNDDDYKQKIDDNVNFLLNLRLRYNTSILTADLAALPLSAPNTPIVFPASIISQLSYDADKKQLNLIGYMSPVDKTALLALSTDAAYQAAINSLYNAAQQTDSTATNLFFASAAEVNTNLKSLLNNQAAARFAFFINKLSPLYSKLKQQKILVKNISAWFKADKKTIQQLLASVPGIFDDFTNDNFVNKSADLNNPTVPYPVQSTRYQFVAKVCFVVAKLKLTIDDLAFLMAHAADINTLNFQGLPLAPVTVAVTTFPTFENLINLLRFEQYYPVKVTDRTTNAVVSIYTILLSVINKTTLTPAEITALKASLVSLTGWKASDLDALITTPNLLTLTLPADIRSVSVLLRLHQCFVTIQQLGIAAIDAVSWCKPSLTFADTAKIKQTLKSKYTNSDWLAVTQPLQDKLREKKRDALIAYLLANPGTQTWKDDNDLYSYFLLDVEMCSCQPTSRIVQATNSLQLFVQRCFLDLEDSITVNSKVDSNWLQWKWMKNFRVWQANVKVFLYPENWIEPELLPEEIKSPFLKELESELLQNEVTALHAEDAFRNYLQKLDGVARLEVKGMWYDEDLEVLHVFARTYGGNPRIYYHRRLINFRRWTPWVKVDLDINSDHIVPVMYNKRVYLFWAIFTEQADSNQQINVPVAGQQNFPLIPPVKTWQIQLAFSEYKEGKWAPQKISHNDATGQLTCSQTTFPLRSRFVLAPLDIPVFDYDKIFDDQGVPLDTLEEFKQKVVKAALQNGTLLINCYYYSYAGENSYDTNQYIGSFQLDPIKGYPVLASVPYKILLPTITGISGDAVISTQERSSMINMLDTSNGFRPNNKNFFTPDRSMGKYRNLISTQMGFMVRVNFLFNIYNSKGKPSSTVNQIALGESYPYFYQDTYRTYFAVPTGSDNGTTDFPFIKFLNFWVILLTQGTVPAQEYIKTLTNGVPFEDLLVLQHYYNFQHPLIDYFIRNLFVNGIDGLMDRDVQLKGDFALDISPDKFSFKDYYHPHDKVYSGFKAPVTYPNGIIDSTPGYPKEDVDFSLQSGYGLYNWELFFHAPLMIAERLSQNQQFEDADRWYKYIFNPMDLSGHPSPDKYWNTKPFFINVNDKYIKQRIENILKGINTGQSDLIQNVTDWRNNPFQPHYIAQYRTVAYQKTAVMKYIGHLIRHGDFLFSQHTMESVNEATQLYILAAEILGPKPEIIPPAAKPTVDNYYQLEKKLDSLSDAVIDVENLMPLQSIKGYTGVVPNTPALPNLQTFYFCIPMNENMMGPTGYWDIVADRLFKIRHCLNIDGTLAPLSLFSPVIDPGMLVRATSAGLDIGSILNDVNAPLPLYRFMVMMQKATELCNEVKSLGAAMLAALEKKDAETMGLLRSGHEIKLLGSILSLKQKQIQDAQVSLENLNKQRESVLLRQKYFARLISEGLSSGEKHALDLNKLSFDMEAGIGLGYVLAGGLSLIPNFVLGISGFGGSPHGTAQTGGPAYSDSAEAAVKTLSSIATASDKLASVINTQSTYKRRADEWQHQLNLANKELEQIEKQLLGAQIRIDIAGKDAQNQQLQIDQSKEANDLMRSKFTNEELFSWMVTQISSTYFKSYQLAYDIARQAENCFRYELGLSDSAYINFGYWDSLKKGLLSGEQLSYDLKKMEMAYLEQNKRELELTKHISLSQLDAVALLKLKTTGECWINLPEEVFDMDYPGHYMRRVKSASVTIPCITGPYTTVSCKLTMTRNSVRTSGIATDATTYPRKLSNGVPADDPRFRDAVGALQSIATSSAQNDSGLFELNFHDERYLPFEGAGAISLWHLQLPAAVRQFDYSTISDVILHLKYTARDGGEALKANATESLTSKINQMLVSLNDKGLMCFFSAKNDLSTEWHRFLYPANETEDQSLVFNLDKNRFPLFVQEKNIKITSIELAADTVKTSINNIQVIAPATASASLNLTPTAIYGSWLSGSLDYSSSKKDPGQWVIKNLSANPRITEVDLKNIVIIVHYEIS